LVILNALTVLNVSSPCQFYAADFYRFIEVSEDLREDLHVSWLQVIALGVGALAAMRAALERGDVDEAARQGALAGPAVIERALRAPDRRAGGPGAAARGVDRTTRLAAIAAAPIASDRAELLDALAWVAGGPDRRTAIPAASAASAIARELAHGDRPDDLADDDLAAWRTTWARLAMRGDRWIELRLLALDTAAALDPAQLGVDLAAALHDPDPAFRRAAAAIVPLPAPRASYAPLAAAVVEDVDSNVALAAAQSLCMAIDPASARPIHDALGPAGLARIRTVTGGARPADALAVQAAARCLK
jgi:hypothetical protein